MILFVCGNDTFRAGQFLRESVADFKKKRDPQGYNTIIFDAMDGKPEKVVSELLTPPFLAEKRMVVIKNILSVKDKEFLARILEIVEQGKIKDTNVAVFYQSEKVGQTTEAKKLFSVLKKQKFIYEFVEMSPAELRQWIAREAKKRGGQIGTAGINYLIEHAGGDMWFISSLLDQLISYKAEEDIMVNDIKLFLPEKVEDNIFAAAEMIAQGNKKQAFRLINEQRRLGQNESYLFSMVLRQFKILLQLRDLWEHSDSMPSQEMAQVLGLHPYVVKKSLPSVKRFSLNDLKQKYQDLLFIDIGTKTGVGSPDVALDYFIGKG